jgi:hypothetical protein
VSQTAVVTTITTTTTLLLQEGDEITRLGVDARRTRQGVDARRTAEATKVVAKQFQDVDERRMVEVEEEDMRVV